jgi:hypothetical protein
MRSAYKFAELWASETLAQYLKRRALRRLRMTRIGPQAIRHHFTWRSGTKPGTIFAGISPVMEADAGRKANWKPINSRARPSSDSKCTTTEDSSIKCSPLRPPNIPSKALRSIHHVRHGLRLSNGDTNKARHAVTSLRLWRVDTAHPRAQVDRRGPAGRFRRDRRLMPASDAKSLRWNTQPARNSRSDHCASHEIHAPMKNGRV